MDSVLSMQGAWVQSLVRELDPMCHNLKKRSHTPQLKILHASVKIKVPVCCNEDPVQPNKEINIFKNHSVIEVM